jgi:predicted nucleic acid-binding protein
MMAVNVFLDTNILLRASIAEMPLHNEAVSLVRRQKSEGAELWISRQVIREYIAQVTRPQSVMRPLSATQIEAQVDVFKGLYRIADEHAGVTAHLVSLIRQIPTGGKQIHDANIVATMLAYGIDLLITQNVADMRRFEPKIKIVPLVA